MTAGGAKGATPVGLRERKKERTREDLAAAAIALFIERGYEATTVEDIAAATEVSPRTFFRYYPTKEDVVVELLRAGVVDLQSELSRRPAEEPLPQALRVSARRWADLSAGRMSSLLQLSQVLQSAPLLRARLDETRRCSVAGLSGIVGQRLDLDPAQDARPKLIVSLVLSTIATAIERWSEDGGAGQLADYIDAGFELLECGIPVSCTRQPVSDAASHAKPA